MTADHGKQPTTIYNRKNKILHHCKSWVKSSVVVWGMTWGRSFWKKQPRLLHSLADTLEGSSCPWASVSSYVRGKSWTTLLVLRGSSLGVFVRAKGTAREVLALTPCPDLFNLKFPLPSAFHIALVYHICFKQRLHS